MKSSLPALILGCCVLMFGGTLLFLLKSRFEIGDVYPASSSLRSDPLGTMVLYDSLKQLPGLSVGRDHSASNRLPDGRDHTYLHFAANSSDWKELPADLCRTLDDFVVAGGRLVITMKPESAPPPSDKKEKSKEEKPAKKKEGKKAEEKKKSKDRELVSLAKRWGLEVATLPATKGQNDKRFQVQNVSALPLPKELPWHGDVVLAGSDATWHVIYTSKNGPVLAEKSRGAGTIVVATDSYFVSNEALVLERQADLLAWIVGPSHHVVFDEAHLGVLDSPGLAALARKYRLYGGAAALLVLAALFIWKNSTSLAPPRKASHNEGNVIVGRDAAAGFVGLLRRNVPRDRVLDLCIGEWRKAFARGTRFSELEKAAFEAVVAEENARPSRDRDPVETSRKLSAALSRKSSSQHV